MIRYISLPEFFWLAEQVTGIDAATLAQAGRTDLADSALRAGEAEFGGTGFYPGLAEKAAVLVCRLAWNHPLPDGNKRAAWASLIMFLDLNGARWRPGAPNVDDAEAAIVATAARDVDETWFADWLRARVHFPDTVDPVAGSGEDSND